MTGNMALRRIYSTVGTMSRMGERVGIPDPVMSQPDLHQTLAARLAKLPFFVERTAVGKGLPVYSQLTSGNTHRTTIVRRVYGDVRVLAAWLHLELLGGGGGGRMRVKAEQQKIVIKGDHVEQVKLFLTDLGF